MSVTLLDFLHHLEQSGFYGSVELKYEQGRITVARKTESVKLDSRNDHRNNRGLNADTSS
jgi:hypothetical protein